jgi:hypothetical protein
MSGMMNELPISSVVSLMHRLHRSAIHIVIRSFSVFQSMDVHRISSVDLRKSAIVIVSINSSSKGV